MECRDCHQRVRHVPDIPMVSFPSSFDVGLGVCKQYFFFLALACLFLQCCVNKMVTPHSHVLNLTSVRASALHLCINSFPTDGALEEYSRRPTLHQYSTKELLDLKLDYPCSDVVHRHLQDLSLSVVPVPTRSLPP